MRRAVMVGVVLAATTLVVPTPALGCTVEPMSDEQYLANADVVFEGIAGPHRDPNAGAPITSSGDPIFWTFTVERQIKGTVAPVQEVASARSGATCGIVFEEGVRYRVFASYAGGVLSTGLGSGTRLVQPTPSTTTTVRPTTTTTPRATTSTSPPRRLTLTG